MFFITMIMKDVYFLRISVVSRVIYVRTILSEENISAFIMGNSRNNYMSLKTAAQTQSIVFLFRKLARQRATANTNIASAGV